MNLQPWQNFYMLTGGAAATLSGLMFLAVTFGARLVNKASTEVARAFLDPIILHFVHVFAISCWMMIPSLEARWLAGLLAGVGGLRLIGLWWVGKRMLVAHRVHQDLAWSDWSVYILVPILCYGAHIFIAVRLWGGGAGALALLAATTLVQLIVAILGAWELLVWMAQELSDSKQ